MLGIYSLCPVAVCLQPLLTQRNLWSEKHVALESVGFPGLSRISSVTGLFCLGLHGTLDLQEPRKPVIANHKPQSPASSPRDLCKDRSQDYVAGNAARSRNLEQRDAWQLSWLSSCL